MIKSLKISERLRTVLKDFSISTKVLKDSFSAPDVVTWLLNTCQKDFMLSVYTFLLSIVKSVFIMIGCVVTLGRVAYHLKLARGNYQPRGRAMYARVWLSHDSIESHRAVYFEALLRTDISFKEHIFI